MRPSLTIPITAAIGVAIAFLLRETPSGFSGVTVYSPQATYYVSGNVVYFWGVLGVAGIVSLVLWWRAR